MYGEIEKAVDAFERIALGDIEKYLVNYLRANIDDIDDDYEMIRGSSYEEDIEIPEKLFPYTWTVRIVDVLDTWRTDGDNTISICLVDAAYDWLYESLKGQDDLIGFIDDLAGDRFQATIEWDKDNFIVIINDEGEQNGRTN